MKAFSMPFTDKQPGDHLFVQKRFGGVAPFEHHGIYIGDNKVIHVVRSNSDEEAYIMETDLVEFADESVGEIQELIYPSKFKPAEIVQRAKRFCEPGANEFKYNLTASNCEHFAQFCRLGEWKSDQADNPLNTLDILPDNSGAKAPLARTTFTAMRNRGGNWKR